MRRSKKSVPKYPPSCVQRLATLLDKRGWSTYQGAIITSRQRRQYQVIYLKAVILSLWIGWFVQLLSIPTSLVTLVGETIYMRTVARVLRLYQVPFRWARARSFIPYYIVQSQAVPVLGCLAQNLNPQPFTFLPLTDEEKLQLKQHLGYDLPDIPHTGYYHLSDVVEKSESSPRLTQVGTVGVCSFFSVGSERWLSRFHFTDITGLNSGDEIVGWDEEFHQRKLYQVVQDTLVPIGNNVSDVSSCLYALAHPRPFNSIVIHPFFFPPVRDILLVIRLWTVAWIIREVLSK